MTTSSFAGLLANAQQRLGLKTQEALAVRLGIHLNTVQLYLASKSLPPASRVARLAIDLGLNLTELTEALTSDRALRRAGIPIDTTEQTREALQRLKADATADDQVVHGDDPTGTPGRTADLAGAQANRL